MGMRGWIKKRTICIDIIYVEQDMYNNRRKLYMVEASVDWIKQKIRDAVGRVWKEGQKAMGQVSISRMVQRLRRAQPESHRPSASLGQDRRPPAFDTM